MDGAFLRGAWILEVHFLFVWHTLPLRSRPARRRIYTPERKETRGARDEEATSRQFSILQFNIWPPLSYITTSYGYGQSLRVPAVDRITKEKERENTVCPDIARPTGKHGTPDWFLA